MKKLHPILLMFTLLVSSVAFASEKAAQDPVKVIQSTIVKLNQLTAATTYSPQIMVFLVDQEISPLFDFEHIAASVLSASRINIGTEDANFFTNLLRKNIIKNLLAKLSQGRGNSFSFVSARPTAYGDILVKLNAKGYSRYGLDLDLHFHKNQSGKWQIFDVALGRDSLIDYYKKIVQIKVRRYGVYGMLGSI